MSAQIRKTLITTTARDLEAVNDIRATALRSLDKSTSVTKPYAARDLLASDIPTYSSSGLPAGVTATNNGSAYTITNTNSAATTINGLFTLINASVPQGKAYVWYGYAILSSPTLWDGIQFNVNGNQIPLQPVPLLDAQTGPDNAVYFTPVTALVANQNFSIALHANNFSLAAGDSFSFQIKGYIAENAAAQ